MSRLSPFFLLFGLVFLLTTWACSPNKNPDSTPQKSPTQQEAIEFPDVPSDSNMWGLQFNPVPFHARVPYRELNTDSLSKQLPKLLQATEQLGTKWVRLSVDWSTVEDSSGQYHWDLLDQSIDGLRERDIKIYLCLHGGHSIHTNQKPPRTKKELQAWKDWTRAMVKRYKDRVRHWEVWNEANSVWFWDGDPNPDEYIRLLRQTSTLIRDLQPNATIIGGSLARSDTPFLDSLLARDLHKWADIVTFHPYGTNPEQNLRKAQVPAAPPLWYKQSMNVMANTHQKLQNQPKAMELWQGECGYPSGHNSRGWTGLGPWNRQVQSKWILRRAMVDLLLGCKLSAYFCLHEFGEPSVGDRNFKGLLKLQTLEKKPGFHTYKRLTGLLPGEITVDTTVDLKLSIQKTGSFRGIGEKELMAMAFESGNGDRYLAYWLPTTFQGKVNPGEVKVKIQGASYPNKAQVLDLHQGSAKPLKAKNGTFSELALYDYPILLRFSEKN